MKNLDTLDVILYGLWLGSAMIAIDYFLIPYFELDGVYNQNSYKDINDKNPFIRQNLSVKPTDTKMNVTFGFRGNISSKIAFNAKINYTII